MCSSCVTGAMYITRQHAAADSAAQQESSDTQEDASIYVGPAVVVSLICA
jgi:hypothetical protein